MTQNDVVRREGTFRNRETDNEIIKRKHPPTISPTVLPQVPVNPPHYLRELQRSVIHEQGKEREGLVTRGAKDSLISCSAGSPLDSLSRSQSIIVIPMSWENNRSTAVTQNATTHVCPSCSESTLIL